MRHILFKKSALKRIDNVRLLLQLAEELETGRHHVVVLERRVHTCLLVLFLLGASHLIKLLNDLVDHRCWANRTLVAQMQTEVDGCFAHLCLHITALLEDEADNRQELMLELIGLKVAEESWKSLLEQLQNHQVVVQIDVLDSFLNEQQKDLEADFWWLVASVDLAVHRISAPRVEVV